MLNIFPGLLLPFLAPTLLRVVVGLLFVYFGWRTWRHAAQLGKVELPLVGARAWLPYFASLCEVFLGLMFMFGWYTQIAALVGVAGAIKYAVYRRWWPNVLAQYLPLSPLAMGLVAAICLSLVLSGAGAFARDLPL